MGAADLIRQALAAGLVEGFGESLELERAEFGVAPGGSAGTPMADDSAECRAGQTNQLLRLRGAVVGITGSDNPQGGSESSPGCPVRPTVARTATVSSTPSAAIAVSGIV
jgi:hypothetical protein